MPEQRVKRVIGNWKMHGRLDANQRLLTEVARGAENLPAGVAVCVPFPYLAQVQSALQGSQVAWGVQDVSAHEEGAYTGEVAAGMVGEFGACYAIVGHSERRMHHGERDAVVAAKARRSLDVGLTPVVCIGETLEQREAEQTEAVVLAQLDAVLQTLSAAEAARIVVAYEPVWAIGTGRSATAEQAQHVHGLLRMRLTAKGAANVALLYGGSVKPSNAEQLFSQPDIDGGLIGGASLQSDDFLAIAERLFG